MADPNQQAMSLFDPKPEDGTLRVLIAPSNFKESAHADQIADWIETGILLGMGNELVVTKKCPIYDGGEGFVRGMVMAHGGVFRQNMVPGPMSGQHLLAQWGLINQGTTAVIEIASVAGLHLIPKQNRDIKYASSRGVGQLINIILSDPYISKLIVGCGDSGVSDAGAGMLSELGFGFFNANHEPVLLAGGVPDLVTAYTIEPGEIINPRLIPLPGFLLDPNYCLEVDVVCNTENILVGPPGVVELYGPQKGGRPEDVQPMTLAMRAFVNAVNRSPTLHNIHGSMPGSGASGGIGAALLALGARVMSREDAMSRYFDIHDTIIQRPWDLIITAEGSLDAQSTKGKALGALMKIAGQRNIPVIAIAGTVDPRCVDNSGLWSATSVVPGPIPLPIAVRFTEALVTEQTKQVIRLIRLGRRLGYGVPHIL